MGRADGGDAHPGALHRRRSGSFERKFDGIRLLAFKHGAEVRLFSRNRLPQNLPADRGGDRGAARATT